MFTGIVQSVGEIMVVENIGGDARLQIATDALNLSDVKLGDSVAVNGVCLTIVKLDGREFSADASRETLAVTTLGTIEAGHSVNLEPALTLGASLGGHLVSGHVDGISQVLSMKQEARSMRMGFDLPERLARYVARKGSVTIDGTSLTVNEVSDTELFVNIVPHTFERTIMSGYSVGTQVNIEVDMIARYLERLVQK
jgi:riboflavin synthase